MRVGIVTETWRPSVNGVVTLLDNTIRHLQRAGHKVLVVAPTVDPALTGLAGVEQRQTPVVSVSWLYGGQPWAVPGRTVARALREFRPDVVHIVNPVLMGSLAAGHAPSDTDTLGLVLLEAMAAGVPIVATASPAAGVVLDGYPLATVVPRGSPSDALSAAVVDVLRRGRSLPRPSVAPPGLGWGAATAGLVEHYRAAQRRRWARSGSGSGSASSSSSSSSSS